MPRWILMFAALSAVLLLRGSVFALGGDFVVVEEIPLGLKTNEGISFISVSADGRYITYDVTDNSNKWLRVVVYDRATNTRTKLSDRIPAYYSVTYPHISANGRYVVFTAYEAPYWQGKVYGYLFDLKTGGYTNVLKGANGQILQSAEGGTVITDMSSDGRYIVYTSSAFNPFDGKNVNCIDYDNSIYPCNAAFLYDRGTGKTERISVNNNEALANGDTYGTRVSDDGRYVLFESRATNLEGGNIICGSGYCAQLYIRDRQLGTTRLLTKNSDGKPASTGIMFPFFMNLSKDGKYASYVSGLNDSTIKLPSNNMPKDTSVGVVFMQNIATGEHEITSVSSQGTLPRAGNLDTGDISLDNRYTLFTSSDLQAINDDPAACDPTVPGESCPSGVFLRDRVAKTTTFISLHFYLVNVYASNIVGDANQIILYNQVLAAANATLPQPSNLKAKRISNTQIDLTWTDNAGGGAAYHVERSLDGLTKWQEVRVTAVGATSFSDTTVACGARYHYRVSGADTVAGTVSINSFYDDANIPVCTLPPISLKSPANGARINTSTPAFEWRPVAGAKQYRLVVTASNGDKPVDQVFKAEDIALMCDTELCSFDLSANSLTLPDGDYTWKVKAKVISGLKTESGVRALEVDAFGAPTLLSPADGATDIALSPVFTWQAVGIGTGYKVVIKLNDVEVFEHPVTEANCVETVCTLDTAGLLTLEGSQIYVWRVIAKNNGDKEKSAKWTFTTGASSVLAGLELPGN